MAKNFKVRWAGASNDLRTNKWELTCLKCKKSFTPPTTMLSTQSIECPNKKCGNSEVINYNNEN